MRTEEGNYGVSVGGRYGGEQSGAVKRAGIEEIRGFYRIWDISNRALFQDRDT